MDPQPELAAPAPDPDVRPRPAKRGRFPFYGLPVLATARQEELAAAEPCHAGAPPLAPHSSTMAPASIAAATTAAETTWRRGLASSANSTHVPRSVKLDTRTVTGPAGVSSR